MKQIRFQPLNETYQKLSTLLCKTALSIQTTDYRATEEWVRLIQQVKNTYAAFKAFAETEEETLFPVLHHYEPALAAILRDNQCNRLTYLHDLYAVFATKYNATDKHKSMMFSHKLLYRLDEFVASTMQQLKEQEQMLNAVLWRYYSDKELVQMAALFSMVPSAQLHNIDTTFADSIIKNIIPEKAGSSTHKKRNTSKTIKQYCAPKELALAI